MYPADLKYTRNHEYLKVLEDGTALVGITDYAQAALGDVVFIDLPEPGTRFEAGDCIGTVESVKTVSEVFMPASGEVLEVNEELSSRPELMNEDAFGLGWMIRAQLIGAPAAELLDAAAYAAFVEQESH
jgi:glycine cleavage system H protein